MEIYKIENSMKETYMVKYMSKDVFFSVIFSLALNVLKIK